MTSHTELGRELLKREQPRASKTLVQDNPRPRSQVLRLSDLPTTGQELGRKPGQEPSRRAKAIPAGAQLSLADHSGSPLGAEQSKPPMANPAPKKTIDSTSHASLYAGVPWKPAHNHQGSHAELGRELLRRQPPRTLKISLSENRRPRSQVQRLSDLPTTGREAGRQLGRQLGPKPFWAPGGRAKTIPAGAQLSLADDNGPPQPSTTKTSPVTTQPMDRPQVGGLHAGRPKPPLANPASQTTTPKAQLTLADDKAPTRSIGKYFATESHIGGPDQPSRPVGSSLKPMRPVKLAKVPQHFDAGFSTASGDVSKSLGAGVSPTPNTSGVGASGGGGWETGSGIVAQGEILSEGEILASPLSESVLEGPPLGCELSADCGFSCPEYLYTEADALYLVREDDSQITSSDAFRLGEFDWELQGRFTVGKKYDCLRGWELTYVGPFVWTLLDQRAGGPFFATFNPAGGLDFSAFDNAVFHHLSYTTKLHSFEANRKRWGWDVFSTTVGVRYINVDEDFRFFSVNGDGVSGLFQLRTENDLVGVQLGMELIQPLGNFSFGWEGKVGAYGNSATVQATVINAGIAEINNQTTNIEFAALGESRSYIRYQLSHNIAIRAGYEFWYLYGVALAREQPPLRNAPPPARQFNLLGNPIGPQVTDRRTPVGRGIGGQVDAFGDLFLHGASLGVEIAW